MLETKTLSLVSALWERKRPLMLQRLTILDRAAEAAAVGSLEESLCEEALSEAHKLAGSLGTFGFAKGTEIARELEVGLEAGTLKPERMQELTRRITRDALSDQRHQLSTPSKVFSLCRQYPGGRAVIITEMDVSVNELLKAGGAAADEALESLLPGPDTPPHSIHRAMRHSTFAGGKRLRPILCMEAARMVGGGELPAGAAELGAALEMLHTYSLIHDDLPALDNDDLRRGQPTCHVVFGEAIAILAGDALQTLAFQVISRLPAAAETVVEVLREVAAGVGDWSRAGGRPADGVAAGHDRRAGDGYRVRGDAADGGAGGGDPPRQDGRPDHRERGCGRIAGPGTASVGTAMPLLGCAASGRRRGWRSRSWTTSWT